MAINLKKIRSDLNHGDPQIQTFALMSITRLSPQLVDSVEELQSVYDKLQTLIKSDNPDVVFLARKASNHIDSVFRPYFKELEVKEARKGLDPTKMGREDMLRNLDASQDPKFMASLVMRFVELGKREDLSALRPFLQHQDDRVRSNTVEVFQALGNENNVEDVKPLLKDRNNRVRGNAILALVRLGYKDVRRNIEEMLCMGMISMRETAVYVLSQLDEAFVEELLIRASHDPYDGVRLRASKALGNFITRPAIVRLKQLMNDIDINICEAAVESLRRIKRVHEELKRDRSGSRKPLEHALASDRDGVPEVGITPLDSPTPAAEPAKTEGAVVQEEPSTSTLESSSAEGVAHLAEQPAAEQPAAGQSAAGQPAAGQPAAGQPAAEQPAAGQSAAGQPAAGQPAAEQPAAEQPAAGQPAAGLSPGPGQASAEQPGDGQACDLPLRPSESSRREEEQAEVLRDIGTEIYQLCRMNEITHEALDNIFYEILRYQDFLRAYLVKKQKGVSSDVSPRNAIEQLQAKIKNSFAQLGLCAVKLLDKGKLKLCQEHAASINELMEKLRPNE